ncbi:hypothetical protein GJ496_007548 [Pomphorhynchus laevis]|nr:hypothetical protein GJ496_007548 [Pomphorhynchus laevis]
MQHNKSLQEYLDKLKSSQCFQSCDYRRKNGHLYKHGAYFTKEDFDECLTGDKCKDGNRESFQEQTCPTIYKGVIENYSVQPEKDELREVLVNYFSNTNSISVYEKPSVNAGYKQGTLIAKNKFFSKHDNRFYNADDFYIGSRLRIGGFNIKLVDTYDIFQDQVKQPILQMQNNELKLNEFPAIKIEPVSKLKFEALWNDPQAAESHYFRHFDFKYYLSDGTCELIEHMTTAFDQLRINSSTFLRRTKLPKKHLPYIWLIGIDEPILLNRNVQRHAAKALIVDKRPAEPIHHSEYYTALDFDCDKYISVYDKDFLLINCNPETRDYYQRVHQITLNSNQTIEQALDKLMPHNPKGTLLIPKPIPFGTEEDTLKSVEIEIPAVKSLVSAALEEIHTPKSVKDKLKRVLSFKAASLAKHKFLQNIEYSIDFHPDDSTFEIYETDINTEKALKIMNRRLLSIPPFTRRKNMMPYEIIRYDSKDIYEDSVIHANGVEYELQYADDISYKYMKENRHLFVIDNDETALKLAVNILKPSQAMITADLHRLDRDETGWVPYTQFENICMKYVSESLSNKYQLVRIARNYRKQDTNIRDPNKLVKDRFNKSKLKIIYMLRVVKENPAEYVAKNIRIRRRDSSDNSTCEDLDPNEVRQALQSCGIRIPSEDLNNYINGLVNEGENRILLSALVDDLKTDLREFRQKIENQNLDVLINYRQIFTDIKNYRNVENEEFTSKEEQQQ